MRTRGGRGSKIPKILRTYLMDGPLTNVSRTAALAPIQQMEPAVKTMTMESGFDETYRVKATLLRYTHIHTPIRCSLGVGTIPVTLQTRLLDYPVAARRCRLASVQLSLRQKYVI